MNNRIYEKSDSLVVFADSPEAATFKTVEGWGGFIELASEYFDNKDYKYMANEFTCPIRKVFSSTEYDKNGKPLSMDYKEFLHKSLQDLEECKAYLKVAMEDPDSRVFLLALEDVWETNSYLFENIYIGCELEIKREEMTLDYRYKNALLIALAQLGNGYELTHPAFIPEFAKDLVTPEELSWVRRIQLSTSQKNILNKVCESPTNTLSLETLAKWDKLSENEMINRMKKLIDRGLVKLSGYATLCFVEITELGKEALNWN